MSTLEQTADAVEATDTNRSMSALDRCDSCGAQAYVRAVLSGSELLFCAHHAHKHEEKLRPIADSWYDESHKLHA